MSVIKNIDKIWQNMARQQLENELNFLITDDNKKIKLTIDDNIDYLKMYNDTHKTPEEELQDRINKAIEYIKEWQHFPHTNGSTHKELENLMNILRGNNENE